MKAESAVALAAVVVGGAAGAVARYAVNGWAQREFPGFAPAGTLIVNVAGCLVIGLLMAFVRETVWISHNVQLLLVTGFLGSLTTFSTFGYQTLELLELQQLRQAGINLAANLVFGLAAVALGLKLGRLIVGWWA